VGPNSPFGDVASRNRNVARVRTGVGYPRAPLFPPRFEVPVNASVLKVGKLLLAVALGAAASFGTTVAAHSEPSGQSLACVGSHGGTCTNDCIEDGFDYGRCYGDCVCFYAY
jgi:hypothetical protein